MRYFASQSYGNASEVVRHAVQVSKKLKATQPPNRNGRQVGKALTVLGQAVLETAPRYRKQAYGAKLISADVASQMGRRKDDYLTGQVKGSIRLLREAKLLPKPGVPKRFRLRTVPATKVEQHRDKIKNVLENGHRYLPKNWKRFLTYRQAYAIGKKGLKRGLELHDPERGYPFNAYLKNWISSKIQNKVNVMRNKAKNSDKKTKVETTPHGNGVEKAPTTFQLKRRIAALLRKTKKKHYIGVFALVEQGNNYGAIAREIGVKKQAVHSIYKRAAQLAGKHA